MARARVSATPPGGKLTINLIGLSGQVCAAAPAHSEHAAINATALRAVSEVIDMVPPLVVPGTVAVRDKVDKSIQATSTSTSVGTDACIAPVSASRN